jgi:transcriptional regulator with XRE-family HTH domain
MSPIQIRIRDLRTEQGLTQVQLAERCGMPQSTISRIESGTTSGVDFNTLDRVAEALGVHPSELIAFTEVTFDYKGRSYVVNDVTREIASVPDGATTVWGIRGTRLTFTTGRGTTPGAVIRKAKKLLSERV